MQKAPQGIKCIAINNSSRIIYIPLKYHIRQAKDSLIMEPIALPDKGDVTLNYNVFMPPKMNKLMAHNTMIFFIAFKGYSNLNKRKVYFKIYDQDYIQTLGSRKFTSTVADFIKFDKIHSRLQLATF